MPLLPLQQVIASAKIMWEGEELNLSLMRKYMRSQDRNTRKKAWDAFSGFFEENQAELDEIYDLMVRTAPDRHRCWALRITLIWATAA